MQIKDVTVNRAPWNVEKHRDASCTASHSALSYDEIILVTLVTLIWNPRQSTAVGKRTTPYKVAEETDLHWTEPDFLSTAVVSGAY